MIAIATQAFSTAVGIWLMFAPAELGYGGIAANNDRIAGPIAASLALVAMFEVVRAVRRANLVVGAWLVVAAFVLPYPAVGTVSAVLAGLALVAASIPEGERRQRYGGGWRSLWRGEHR